MERFQGALLVEDLTEDIGLFDIQVAFWELSPADDLECPLPFLVTTLCKLRFWYRPFFLLGSNPSRLSSFPPNNFLIFL
jgi:hypothetical protein